MAARNGLSGWVGVAVASAAVLFMAGCEITASAFVEKEWRTDPNLYSKPDATARIELKASRLVGRDAKIAERKNQTGR